MTVIKRFVDFMCNWQELVSTTVIWFKLWLMWTVMYAGKWDNSRKICAGMLLRFQWQIEKLWQELGLGQRYFSVSPLRLNMTKYNQRLCMNANRIQIEEILKTDKSGFDSKQIYKTICDVLCDLVLLEQFKKCEKHQWRGVTFSKVAGFWLLACNFTKSNNPPWVFLTSFKLYQIAQNITSTWN